MIDRKLKIPVESVQKYEELLLKLKPNHEDNREFNNKKIFEITTNYHKNCFGDKSVGQVFQEVQLSGTLDQDLSFDFACKGMSPEYIPFLDCFDCRENSLMCLCHHCFKSSHTQPE